MIVVAALVVIVFSKIVVALYFRHIQVSGSAATGCILRLLAESALRPQAFD
jgi:hypothetical protein